jgi:hypothetical protein
VVTNLTPSLGSWDFCSGLRVLVFVVESREIGISGGETVSDQRHT